MEHLADAYQGDLRERRFGPEGNEKKIDGWRAITHEIKDSGMVYEDENVKIEAFHSFVHDSVARIKSTFTCYVLHVGII